MPKHPRNRRERRQIDERKSGRPTRKRRLHMRELTVPVSSDNIKSQVEAFLRATTMIKDDELVEEMVFTSNPDRQDVIPIRLKLRKEEVKTAEVNG